ncbi:MAG: hypothetical protein K2Q06_16280, partial [Parvularculaceae bacterium]|nr:hypothetical protein [Parvularculaceae bacterium]
MGGAAALAVLGGAASAATVSFEGLADLSNVGTISGITFTNAQARVPVNLTGVDGTTAIRFTGSAVQGTTNIIGAAFSSAVSSVSIRAIDVGAAGAVLRAYNAANVLVGTATATGLTQAGIGEWFPLSVAGAGIVRIELAQLGGLAGAENGDGILWDLLQTQEAVVPVPAAALLFPAGIAALGAM